MWLRLESGHDGAGLHSTVRVVLLGTRTVGDDSWLKCEGDDTAGAVGFALYNVTECS